MNEGLKDRCWGLAFQESNIGVKSIGFVPSIQTQESYDVCMNLHLEGFERIKLSVNGEIAFAGGLHSIRAYFEVVLLRQVSISIREYGQRRRDAQIQSNTARPYQN